MIDPGTWDSPEAGARPWRETAPPRYLLAIRMQAFGDVAIIPLHIQKNIWATRAGYSFVPTVGETLHLVDVKPGK